MTKTDMPDVPIAIVQRLGQEPEVTMPLSAWLRLLALARETVERGAADESKFPPPRFLGDKELTPEEADSLIRDITESIAEVLDPAALDEARELDEDLADCIALEEARRRDEETVPHELVKRLMAGEHPMKVYREHRGLTQAALAERTGLSAMYLSQIETGRRGGSTKTLRKIARALNVDLDDLARWDEDDEAGSEAPPAWLVKRAIPKAKPTSKTRSRRDLDLSGKAELIKTRAKSRKRSRRDLDLDG